MITRIEFISDDLARRAVAFYVGLGQWFVRAKTGAGHDCATWASLPSEGTAKRVCRIWVDDGHIANDPPPEWRKRDVGVCLVSDLPLFDSRQAESMGGAYLAVSEIRIVECYGERAMAWTCPHCGGEVTGGWHDETPETAAADPACAACRAAFIGVSMGAWRRMPLSERMAERPPAGWTRKTERAS